MLLHEPELLPMVGMGSDIIVMDILMLMAYIICFSRTNYRRPRLIVVFNFDWPGERGK